MAIDIAAAPSPSFSEHYPTPEAPDQFHLPGRFAEVGAEELHNRAMEQESARLGIDQHFGAEQQPQKPETVAQVEFTPDHANRFTAMGHALVILRNQESR